MLENGKGKGRDPLEDEQHPDPLLVSAKELARLLGISLKTIGRRRQTRHIPPPVQVGSLVRWQLATIIAWVADGCPHMDDWDMPNDL